MAKRLKRNRVGSIILPSGETITKAEQKLFHSTINSANARRNRFINSLSGTAKLNYDEFGIETDFMYRKRSESYSRFQNKGDFYYSLNMAKRYSSGEFEETRRLIYKENYIRSVLEVFDGDNDRFALAKKLQSMSPKEITDMIDNGDLEPLEYLYFAPNEKDKRIARLMDQLNINEPAKAEDIDYLNQWNKEVKKDAAKRKRANVKRSKRMRRRILRK